MPVVPIDVKGLPKQLFINNKFVDAKSKRTYPVINPSTEEVICEVAEAGAADVDDAVAAARAAFETGEWSKTGPYERSKLLWRLADLIEKKADYFASLESLDNGKPYAESSAADIPLVVQCFRYYGGAADKLTGKTLELGGPLVDSSFTAYTLHEPVGVIGQIVPWNFPLLMVAWKLGPALATGCSVVLKLAEQTPLSGLLLCELLVEAGYPPGAVNILSGWGDVTTDGQLGPGLALVRHKDVDKIAFTGSGAVGKEIAKEAAQTFKRVSLELGGKSPMIVFPDADLDAAVAGALVSQFFNQGQVCTAGSRTFVHEDIYDDYMKKLLVAAKEGRKIGNPLEEGTTQGPQVSQEQFDRVMGYIDLGKKEGATCALGGEREGTKGYFVQPTIFTDVKEDMTIWKEEIFGPVMAVTKFKTIDEVIEKANKTDFGLAAAVWTNDIGTAQITQKRLRAGTVWINCYNVFDANMAFGGFKSSGIGRELGEYALSMYTEVKQICMKSKPVFK